jgi:hypothetical protein
VDPRAAQDGTAIARGVAHAMRTLALTIMLTVGAVLFFGCSAAQNAVDCSGICDRYQTCFDASYDTSACEQRCRDNANSDADYMAKSTDCDNCIGDKSCASATFACGTQCAGIVP